MLRDEKPEVVRRVNQHQILVRPPVDPVERRMGMVGPRMGAKRVDLCAEPGDRGGIVVPGMQLTVPLSSPAT